MNKEMKKSAKLEKAPMHFEEPRDVAADDSLSQRQKVKALDQLEQDARQLAEASSEGMAGGERNKLHDVLIAKDELDLPRAEASTANRA
ncbi:MAG TPA: hypothetical protein VNH44_12485 [Micropepsaceae bacterium]|nr:hypothetical protein [Micropepsaceae bacterium]